MSTTVRQEWLERFAQREEDPEVEARTRELLYALLSRHPDVRRALVDEGLDKGIEKGIEKEIEKGRLTEARAALREVLAGRQIVLAAADEARIEACADLAMLKRWHRQAVTAATAADALR